MSSQLTAPVPSLVCSLFVWATFCRDTHNGANYVDLAITENSNKANLMLEM